VALVALAPAKVARAQTEMHRSEAIRT